MLRQSNLQGTCLGLDLPGHPPSEPSLGRPRKSTGDENPSRSHGQASPGSIGLVGSEERKFTHGYGRPERGRRIAIGALYLIVQHARGEQHLEKSRYPPLLHLAF